MTDEAGLLEIEKDRKTKTAVICPVIKTAAGMMTAEEEAARENEAAGLVLAMGQEVVFCETVRMSAIVPKSFFGKGTLERLRTACEEKGAELLVVDMPVPAVQQRNLEKMLNMKVIDRTAVILEIFGQRAQTREGKLPGGTGASDLPARQAGAELDTPGAPKGRRRLSRRAGRNADRT